jgi:hypothetical protein
MNDLLDRFGDETPFDPLFVAGSTFQRGGPRPDRRNWVIRPEDLLVLDFELVNLRIQESKGPAPATLVKKGRGQAYLVVWFPPQHLAEEAYYNTMDGFDVPDGDPDEHTIPREPGPPPIRAILSGWSRLVFCVPDEHLPIPWTLEGLLNVMGELELSVPANALPPSTPQMQLRELLMSALERSGLVRPALLEEIRVRYGLSPGLGAVDKMVMAEYGRAVSAGALPYRAGGQVITVARARRKLRLLGSYYGAAGLTGSDTRNLHIRLLDDLGIAPIIPIGRQHEPGPPTATQTALELPYRIILSPNRFGGWCHSLAPVTSEETGHTELWHTCLGLRDGKGSLPTLRAVWAKDDIPPPNWRMSLDADDRHDVVHLSSNYWLRVTEEGAERAFEPRPLDVDLLALTSLGAWLDSRGVWDGPRPQGLDVEEWRHRATLGRDHYVRVVRAGYLFPWGHRASLVTVTERQFHPDLTGAPAYLRQCMFVVVREPLKTYRDSGLKYEGDVSGRHGEHIDLMMPFETVRITTRVSPLLDPPDGDDPDITERSQGCFWPSVSGQPFKFRLVATDTDCNRVDLAMPLIFVEEDQILDFCNAVPDLWPGDPEEQNDRTEKEMLRATVPMGGQRIALAESAAPDDTTFAVETLTFGAVILKEDVGELASEHKPPFLPVVRFADIHIPSLQAIARKSAAAPVVFAGAYLKNGFSPQDNKGEVFLAKNLAKDAFNVLFSSQGDRSGGLITPDLNLVGLSRITGPISGDPSDLESLVPDINPLAIAAGGTFDPTKWFGALDGAKLFGVLSLTDILAEVGFDAVDMLPKFVGQSLNQVEQLIANIERLRTLLTTDPVNETQAIRETLNQLLGSEPGSIPALLEAGLDDVATVVEQIRDQIRVLIGQLYELQTALPDTTLPPGPKALVSQAISTLQNGIGALGNIDNIEEIVDTLANLLQSFAQGDLLPEALDARFEWRPKIRAWPAEPDRPIFIPLSDREDEEHRNLLLAVQAAGEDFTVLCSLDDFQLDLYFVILDFERVQLRMRAGEKPEVDVRFKEEDGFKFEGPLSFVETLRDIIPFDGFSDPPDVEVTAEGIKAGFSMGLPNLAVGVFSLENLSLAAGFSVPFLGPPMSVWFSFCERENPSRLTVTLFGGGFFFGLTLNANGLYLLEGAIEFGAAISVDFGVASGGVSAMGGLYFKMEGSDDDDTLTATLAGYFRLRGEVEALGLVSVSIELYLEMIYQTASRKCVGSARLSIEIDVTLFSTTIELECTKEFAGAGADPTFAELVGIDLEDIAADPATSEDWVAYCTAFA